MTMLVTHQKCLVLILVTVLIGFGTWGISYGQIVEIRDTNLRAAIEG